VPSNGYACNLSKRPRLRFGPPGPFFFWGHVIAPLHGRPSLYFTGAWGLCREIAGAWTAPVIGS
jgi:hypothetical protein